MIDLIHASKATVLLDKTGIGPVTVAVVYTAWSHAGRVRSEAAFAALAGVNPTPASSGNTIRHRLNRGGDRRLSRALHMAVITRMTHDPETRAYVERRTNEGLSKREIIRCLIGGVSPLRLGPRLAVAPRSCRGMASLPSHRLMASLSTATLDTPRPSTGVRDLPDPGPNNEEPAKASTPRSQPPTPMGGKG